MRNIEELNIQLNRRCYDVERIYKDFKMLCEKYKALDSHWYLYVKDESVSYDYSEINLTVCCFYKPGEKSTRSQSKYSSLKISNHGAFLEEIYYRQKLKTDAEYAEVYCLIYSLLEILRDYEKEEG